MYINPFIPMLLIWTLPFLNLDLSTDAEGFQSKIKNKTANSVDPDEMAHSEIVSSGSPLCGQVLVLVCQDKRVKICVYI